jgi:hypothetical protein
LVIKKKPLWVIGVLAIQLMAIGPWAWRNTALYGRFVPLTAAGGYDLWVGNNPQADGEEIPAQVVSEYKDQYGFLAADRYGAEQYVKFIVQEPVRFLELQGIKTIKFFSVIRTSAWWFHLSGIARGITFFLSAGFFILLLLFGIPGIYSALRSGPGPARILSALALTVPLAVSHVSVPRRPGRFGGLPLPGRGIAAAFHPADGRIDHRRDPDGHYYQRAANTRSNFPVIFVILFFSDGPEFPAG